MSQSSSVKRPYDQKLPHQSITIEVQQRDVVLKSCMQLPVLVIRYCRGKNYSRAWIVELDEFLFFSSSVSLRLLFEKLPYLD